MRKCRTIIFLNINYHAFGILDTLGVLVFVVFLEINKPEAKAIKKSIS